MTTHFYNLEDGAVFKFDPSVSQRWKKINDGQIMNLQTGNVTTINTGEIKVEKELKKQIQSIKNGNQ